MSDQGRAGWRDDEYAVSEIPEAIRKQEDLSLSAAPASARIDV
jgi:hypothetical protein